MPNATSSSEAVRKELKTLPDGYVVLRQMSYGQILHRRGLMKLSLKTTGKKNADFEGEMAMANAAIQAFEFQNCVTEHNLEDVDGRLLNLSNPVDFAKLDPRVGQEVESLIEEMNNFDEAEDDPELGN